MSDTEDDDMNGPSITEIVQEVVDEEDLRLAKRNLDDIAEMAGSFYRALMNEEIPNRIIDKMMLKWMAVTMGDDEPDGEYA